MYAESIIKKLYQKEIDRNNVSKYLVHNNEIYIFLKDASMVNLQNILEIDDVVDAKLERNKLSIQFNEIIKEKEKMAKLDVSTSSSEIIKNVGGEENIITMTHCLTRLRFILKDKEKVNENEIKKVPGVLGATYNAGQYQVILGDSLFTIYDFISKNYNIAEGEAVDEQHLEDYKMKKDTGKKNLSYYFNKVVAFMSASLAPFITALFGAGMLRVIMTLVAYFIPEAAATYTYKLFDYIAQAPFYFMPVLIAYGTAKVMKTNPVFPMVIACALLYPDFVGLAGVEGVTLFGIPLKIITYKSTLLPALFSSILVAYLEKFFYRVVPGVIRSVFAPVCIFIVGWSATVTVLGPIGYIVGSWLVALIEGLRVLVGPCAPGLIAASMMILVAFGVGGLTITPMTELFTTLGYDPVFRPAYICHNIAEGASALGVMFKTKNQDLKASCLSAAIAGIISGVSEPALYGVNFRFKKTMASVLIASFVGGTVAGLFGCKAMAMGYSSALGIVLFTDTMFGFAMAMLASFAIAFILSYILFTDDLLEK